jgi:hypothetical protein
VVNDRFCCILVEDSERSKLGLDAASAHQAPAAQRLEEGEYAEGGKGSANPSGGPQANQPRNDAGHIEDSSRQSSLAVYIGLKVFRQANM